MEAPTQVKGLELAGEIQPSSFPAIFVSSTQTLGMIGILLLMATVFRIFAPAYLTVGSILDILSQSSLLIIISLGMALTIAGGGFDLSVGHVAGFSALLAGTFSSFGVDTIFAVTAGVLIGGLLGAFNGLMVAMLGISSFIATIGMQLILIGFREWVSGGTTVVIYSRTFKGIGDGKFLSIPVPIILMVLVVAISLVLIEKTGFGRKVSAVGGNIEASKLSGINVRLYTALTFVLAGILSSITGIIATAKQGMANVGIGDGYLLDAMTIAVFSMVIFGKMKPIGIVLSTLFLVMLTSGLTSIGVSPSMINLVKGCMLFSAIGLGKIMQFFQSSR